MFVLILGLLIVVLLPTKKTKSRSRRKRPAHRYRKQKSRKKPFQKQLERQLVETLQQVEGVGAVAAAITLETTGKENR